MKTDLKLFWSLALLGLVCVGIGAGEMWFDRASGRLSEDRDAWVDGEARVYEVGIRRATGEPGTRYEMTARYVLTIGGRDYEGSGIAGGYSSKSPAAVKALIMPFAAEAAEYSLQDLSTLNPQRTWSVAYRMVPARYDPRDPAHSEIVLANALMNDSVFAWFLLLTGFALCVFAWPVARWRGTRKPQ
jgi:hypothetical protein